MKTSGYDCFAQREDLKILMLEDSPSDANLCLVTLRRAGYQVHADVVSTYDEFSRCLDRQDYDVVLADYQFPTWSDLKALELLAERGKQIPFILITACYCEETASQMIANGAGDYLLKSRLDRLPAAVRRLLRRQRSAGEQDRMALENESLLEQLRQAGEELARLNGLLLEPLMVSHAS